MNVFLDALSDASVQITGTLAAVVHAFGAGWGKGLDALFDRPAALFYLAAFIAIAVFLSGNLPSASRAGYQRGRFMTANEKSFLMTLDAALGRNYARPVIMRSSRVQALHLPRRISAITLSLQALR